MKSFFPGLPAVLLASGLAFGLAACGGNGDNDPECTVTADCSGAEQCVDGSCQIVDLCAEVSCPGAQTCNDETGACEGECCGPVDCSGPTETCNEDKCLAGDANICDEKTCPGDGPNLGCQEGFYCNLSSLECIAECQRDGCENLWEVCDAQSGQCEDRPPVAGEIGAVCDDAQPCGAGLTCQPWVSGLSTCIKSCTQDSECPSGSYCEPNMSADGSGACMDLCDPTLGDCAEGVQCLEFTRAYACLPFFAESECTTGCLPNGSECDPEQANQCEAGSICNDLMTVPQCQKAMCEVAGNQCAAGESCTYLGGLGLTSCFVDCDAQDATACQDVGMTCQPEAAIDGTSAAWTFTTADVPCNADQETLDLNDGSGFSICYDGCDTAADCGAGQFCKPLQVTQTDTINVCAHYAAQEGACSQASCGDGDCTNIQLNGSSASVCHAACETDADCTADFGGSCTPLSFDGTAASEFSICTYANTGSFCAAGCEADTDCGYCMADADCGSVQLQNGQQRAQRCDLRSNTCVTPLNATGDASTWCRSGQDYWANAILDSEGTTVAAGCGTTCTDDADCAGTCGVDGFCEPVARVCNDATGQCEFTGCTADTAADLCLHGTCAETAGPSGEAICALACGTDQSCEAGTCDTDANICI